MEIRPTGGYPDFASGITGAAAITVPSQTFKNWGWQTNTSLPAQFLTWWMNGNYQWIRYLDRKTLFDRVVYDDFMIATGISGSSITFFSQGQPWQQTQPFTHQHTQNGACGSVGVAGSSGSIDYLKTANYLAIGPREFLFETLVRPVRVAGVSGYTAQIGMDDIGFQISPSGNLFSYYNATGAGNAVTDLGIFPTGYSQYLRLAIEREGNSITWSASGAPLLTVSNAQTLGSESVGVTITNNAASGITVNVDMIFIGVRR